MHRQLDVLNYKQITTLCRVARFPAGLQLHGLIQCHWPWTQPCIPVWVAGYKSPFGIWALVKPCCYMVWWSVKGSVGRRPGVLCTQWVVHPTCPSQSEHLDQMHSLHPSRWHNRNRPKAHFEAMHGHGVHGKNDYAPHSENRYKQRLLLWSNWLKTYVIQYKMWVKFPILNQAPTAVNRYYLISCYISANDFTIFEQNSYLHRIKCHNNNQISNDWWN